tara:strand:- start:3109 stop:3783 length:675 start_codon:yes stop_codon:yes gene_type:complete
MINELLYLSHNLSNFVIYGEGNVSAKATTKEKDYFWIKASGTNLFNLSRQDLILCDKDGLQKDNFNKKPSLEVLFHSFLLSFPDINFIAHTHPTKTMQLLCGNLIAIFAERRFFPDQIVRNGKKSCYIPYVTPGKLLSNNIEFYVKKFCDIEGYFPKLILLQNHGIICAASSAKECIVNTAMCEKSAEIFVGCYGLGSINYLTNNEINEIETCPIEQYRKKILK